MSGFCPNSPWKLEQFLGVDWNGATWGSSKFGHGQVGNGGLSFREPNHTQAEQGWGYVAADSCPSLEEQYRALWEVVGSSQLSAAVLGAWAVYGP